MSDGEASRDVFLAALCGNTGCVISEHIDIDSPIIVFNTVVPCI